MTKTVVLPPKAKKIPKELIAHNDVRVDDYFWLNDRKNKEVIKYLNDENEYYDAMTSKYRDFESSLFEEMKARIKEDDESVPYKYNGYWYITRFEKGKDYPIYSRKKETLDAQEEIIFNGETIKISPSGPELEARIAKIIEAIEIPTKTNMN